VGQRVALSIAFVGLVSRQAVPPNPTLEVVR
jgi:hypothetical protein